MADPSDAPLAKEHDLRGLTVAVTADRRGDDQAVMFGRLGARVVLAPVLSTIKLPDPDLLRRRTEALISQPPDFLIANTGIGMRTWWTCVTDWGLEQAARRALAGTRIAARGPKAAGALSSAGLAMWWRSPSEQLGDVVDHLGSTGLDGCSVAFQLHGDDGSEFIDRLEAAGAEVTALPVYQWRPAADAGPVRALVESCVAGAVDAVTFTAGPQVNALLEQASQMGLVDELVAAFNRRRPLAGCIGPVCASSAVAAGVAEPVVPANWRLGSLVKAVAEALVRLRR